MSVAGPAQAIKVRAYSKEVRIPKIFVDLFIDDERDAMIDSRDSISRWGLRAGKCLRINDLRFMSPRPQACPVDRPPNDITNRHHPRRGLRASESRDPHIHAGLDLGRWRLGR